MLYNYQNKADFSELIEANGKTYLYNRPMAETRRQQIPEFVAALNDARTFLRMGEFPDDIDSVWEIIDRGRDGLLNIVWNRATAEAERLHVQRYVAEQWREKEREAVTREQWEAADAIKSRYDRCVNRFPALRYVSITEEEGHIDIKDDGIDKTIEEDSRIEITQEAKTAVESMKDIAAKVKALELSGISALEIIGSIMRNPELTDAELFNKYIFRRHAPGHIAAVGDNDIYMKVVQTLNEQGHGDL